MRFAEVIGLVMPHTAKPMGIKKISKGGRTFYVPINPDPRRGEGNQVIVKNSFADGKKKGRKGLSKRVVTIPSCLHISVRRVKSIKI